MWDTRENLSIFREQLIVVKASITDYVKAISTYTIYLFANLKLILLALTSLIFHNVLKIDSAYNITIPFAKYILLLIGLIGLANLKFKNLATFSFCALFYCFWWFYTTFSLYAVNGLSMHTVSLGLESCAMLFLTYRIQRDKGLNELNKRMELV